VQPDSRDRSPERYSPGVRFPFRAGLLLGCPRFHPPSHSRGLRLVSPGSPLLGFFLPRAFLRRVPRSPRPGLATEPRKVKVARPSPVPSSGFLPLSTVPAAFAARADPLRDPPSAVTPRRFAALFHAARALWSRPSELSLLEEPYPLSRASCFLAGSHSTAQRRGTVRGFRDTFHRRVDLFATASTRLAGPGGRDDGSLESLGAARLRVATRVCGVSPRIGRARRTRRPARSLRSFAPLESPFSRRPCPLRNTAVRSVLSWAFSP